MAHAGCWDNLLGRCKDRRESMGQRGKVKRDCKSPCLGKFQILPIGDVDVVKRGVTQVQVGAAGEKSF